MDIRATLTIVFLAGLALRATAHADATRMDPPAGAGAMAPRLTESGDGAPLISWLEPGSGGHRLRMSRFVDGAWTPAKDITKGEDLFVNWADVPSVIACGDGTLLCHWLQKSGLDTYAYDVVLARSSDGGATWTTLGSPHLDETETEHGFVSLLDVDGGVRAFWLDGRRMTGHGRGAMTLRTTMIPADAPIEDGVIIDGRVCECCNTSAALADSGPVIVYRDRGPSEMRDIGIVRWVDGAWTRPRIVHRDNWQMPGCPVNGPAVDASGSRVVVAWYTGAGEVVRAAFSSDGGATFDPAINVDEERPVGRVEVHLDASGDAIVCWIGLDGREGVLRLRRVRPDGTTGAVLELTRIAGDRSSGFPTTARVGDDLVVVWNDGAKPSRLGAAVVPVVEVP